MSQENRKAGSREIFRRYQEHIFPAVVPFYGDQPLVVDRAHNQYIWDIQGKRYLDFFGGVLTVSVGHCNEEISERIIKQLKTAQQGLWQEVGKIRLTRRQDQ